MLYSDNGELYGPTGNENSTPTSTSNGTVWMYSIRVAISCLTQKCLIRFPKNLHVSAFVMDAYE